MIERTYSKKNYASFNIYPSKKKISDCIELCYVVFLTVVGMSIIGSAGPITWHGV